jgi:hypothetical protein
MHYGCLVLVFAALVPSIALSEDKGSTRVQGTFVIPKEVASFEGRRVEIRLYKYDSRLADRPADLVEKVELKDFSHTTGKETRKEFVIGAQGELDSRMAYYVTLFILDGDKRTHMGRCVHDKKGIGSVLTHGQPNAITLEVSEIGGPKAAPSTPASPTQAATPSAATFDVRCNKQADSVTVTADGERAIFDIASPSGIGGATIERKNAAWPKQVVLRIHLRGLESLSLASGDLKLSASVASHSGNPRTLILLKKQAKDAPSLTQDSPYWTDIRVLDAKGKPVSGLPDKDGYFEMVVPKALMEENAGKLTISWIDFYR